jgi:hypothetical protein
MLRHSAAIEQTYVPRSASAYTARTRNGKADRRERLVLAGITRPNVNWRRIGLYLSFRPPS